MHVFIQGITILIAYVHGRDVIVILPIIYLSLCVAHANDCLSLVTISAITSHIKVTYLREDSNIFMTLFD